MFQSVREYTSSNVLKGSKPVCVFNVKLENKQWAHEKQLPFYYSSRHVLLTKDKATLPCELTFIRERLRAKDFHGPVKSKSFMGE